MWSVLRVCVYVLGKTVCVLTTLDCHLNSQEREGRERGRGEREGDFLDLSKQNDIRCYSLMLSCRKFCSLTCTQEDLICHTLMRKRGWLKSEWGMTLKEREEGVSEKKRVWLDSYNEIADVNCFGWCWKSSSFSFPSPFLSFPFFGAWIRETWNCVISELIWDEERKGDEVGRGMKVTEKTHWKEGKADRLGREIKVVAGDNVVGWIPIGFRSDFN